MNYNLNNQPTNKTSALSKLRPLLAGHSRDLILAGVATLFNSILSLLSPVIIGIAIDKAIESKDYHLLLQYSAVLLFIYILITITSYAQTRLMGVVGQKVLFRLRGDIFSKLQSLPLSFFNQNKAGDLISRINNDTDKLNQFFSQFLVQFIASIFIMIGAGIFLIVLHPTLGLLTLAPAGVLFIITRLFSPWIKKQNSVNLSSNGSLSARIQEDINNFKVIIAFNRRDYLKEQFSIANNQNYRSSVNAGFANNVFTPVYFLSTNLAQLIVFGYGLYLVSLGDMTIGLLVSFLSYVSTFYNPLRQIAALWANLQLALAGLDRISAIMSLDSDLKILPAPLENFASPDKILSFQNVSFAYESNFVLKNISFDLLPGKTYAFVGPTGGGKTTTASLMARLYDPTEGKVLLFGRDIKSYSGDQLAQKIGFILQEPFLFSGTVRENIMYGNDRCQNYNPSELEKKLIDTGLEKLLTRFDKGLDTVITSGSDTISLGQKQIIAFIRAVLREPDLLILDEATANIDTVTEQILDEIIQKLPAKTTKVIIAHRLNTIEDADEIFFVGGTRVDQAGSLEQAINMLLKK